MYAASHTVVIPQPGAVANVLACEDAAHGLVRRHLRGDRLTPVVLLTITEEGDDLDRDFGFIAGSYIRTTGISFGSSTLPGNWDRDQE